jgi:hypothetical protein
LGPPFGDLAEPRMGPLTARSGVITRRSASLPSAQVKTAAAHIGDRNWNWRKKILCPTMWIVVVNRRY